jgi:hypothetical protein
MGGPCPPAGGLLFSCFNIASVFSQQDPWASLSQDFLFPCLTCLHSPWRRSKMEAVALGPGRFNLNMLIPICAWTDLWLGCWTRALKVVKSPKMDVERVGERMARRMVKFWWKSAELGKLELWEYVQAVCTYNPATPICGHVTVHLQLLA